jgi:GNAT superfamily N-acetyltransferase
MDLVTDACAALRGYYLLGNEVFAAEGATFVRNTACRRRHDANFVTDVRCHSQAEVERLLARVEREFAGFGHRQFHLDPFAPPALAARLALDGFPFNEQLVMSLEGDLRGEAREMDVRAVEGDAGWADFASLQHSDWDEVRHKQGKPPAPAVTIDFLVSKRCKQPHAQFWIVHASGRPAAYLSSWAAGNGIGVVEDLFTHPDFRLRGLATGLLAHAVTDLRQRGAKTIILSAIVDDSPKKMYAALGFTPLYVQRIYNRSVP